MTTFKEFLSSRNACAKGYLWTGTKPVQRAWLDCRDEGWMIWLLRELDFPQAILLEITERCVEESARAAASADPRLSEIADRIERYHNLAIDASRARSVYPKSIWHFTHAALSYLEEFPGLSAPDVIRYVVPDIRLVSRGLIDER